MTAKHKTSDERLPLSEITTLEQAKKEITRLRATETRLRNEYEESRELFLQAEELRKLSRISTREAQWDQERIQCFEYTVRHCREALVYTKEGVDTDYPMSLETKSTKKRLCEEMIPEIISKLESILVHQQSLPAYDGECITIDV